MMRLAVLLLGLATCGFSQPAEMRAWADYWAQEFGVFGALQNLPTRALEK